MALVLLLAVGLAGGVLDKAPGMPAASLWALRSSAKTILPDRNYFVLFANPGQYIKAGSLVTVEIGPFKAEHLVVQP